jgi:integrase
MLGLTWTDVDLGQRVLRVERQVLVRPRAIPGVVRVYLRSTTKSRRVRLVRFDERTEVALRSWKVAQGKERLKFGPAWKTDGGLGHEAPWVVTEADGAVIHPDTLLARWGRLARAAKVPAIPLHGARHSYATLALEAGVRLDVVSHQLGHSSVATTANIYVHVSPAAGAEAAEMMGALLAGTAE